MESSLKDKIVTLLCVVNCTQCVGYIIELQATIKNVITEESCNAAAFLTCTLTYISVGYFVALTLERYLAITEPFRYVTKAGSISRNESRLIIFQSTKLWTVVKNVW